LACLQAAKGLRGNQRIGRSKLPTDHRTFIPASERYRARAEECRHQALTFRDKTAQTQMFQLAADYERKAVQAEAFEPKPAKTA
jgi:hypothetical protein